MQITITLTPEEQQALEFDEADFQFLFESQLEGRINRAKQKIVDLTVRESLKNGTPIPSSEQEVISLGFSKGWAMPKREYLTKLSEAEKLPGRQ